MKLCINCKYFKEDKKDIILSNCTKNNKPSLIDGKDTPDKYTMWADINRRHEKLCGEEGKWFEPC